jgi:hypothetical protein
MDCMSIPSLEGMIFPWRKEPLVTCLQLAMNSQTYVLDKTELGKGAHVCHEQVIKLYEDAERASREHRELRYVQEKSKNETRMGRSVSLQSTLALSHV